jgi:threonine/homoserine/homoserine lactone efflux protein
MISRIPEFFATALVIELTPGPNMSWLAILAAQQGRMAGMRAVAGIALGLSILACAASFGAVAAIQRYPALYEVLRWAGVVLLLLLALEAWVGEKARSAGLGFGPFARGLTINLLNPKAASVFLTLIPGFASSTPPATTELLTLGGLYVLVATLVHALIVGFAGSFRQLATHPSRERLVRRVFAVMLALVAVWLLASTGRPVQ